MKYTKHKSIVIAFALTLCVGLAFVAKENKTRRPDIPGPMGKGLHPCGHIVTYRSMDENSMKNNKHDKKRRHMNNKMNKESKKMHKHMNNKKKDAYMQSNCACMK